jgi:hypothetical protein
MVLPLDIAGGVPRIALSNCACFRETTSQARMILRAFQVARFALLRRLLRTYRHDRRLASVRPRRDPLAIITVLRRKVLPRLVVAHGRNTEPAIDVGKAIGAFLGLARFAHRDSSDAIRLSTISVSSFFVVRGRSVPTLTKSDPLNGHTSTIRSMYVLPDNFALSRFAAS